MDKKAKHYREQASKLRIIADSTSDDTTRTNLLQNVAAFEQMPADRAHPKHPTI